MGERHDVGGAMILTFGIAWNSISTWLLDNRLAMASVWVPFTSESKEAVASYPEITKEIRLALMEAGRRMGAHVRKRKKAADEARKHAYITKYIPHIGDALKDILGLTQKKRDATVEKLKGILESNRKV